MKFLITGASGLVGTALVSFLRSANHEVYCLVRRPPLGDHEIYWNPLENKLALPPIESLEGVIHLAGENIAHGRWTPQKKENILQSRLQGTQLLTQALVNLQSPPRVFISASAMGYYGNRGTEILNEKSHAGQGFLAEVAQQWEQATLLAQPTNIRVIHLRLGLILSETGGVFPLLKGLFQWGLGGKVGAGSQYISWIALADVIRVIEHVLNVETLQGPINVATAHPVTNAEFTQTLGKLLKRPTFLTMPALAMRFILGEMAEELMLSSIRMKPQCLLETGYRFQYNSLEETLRACIAP